MWIIYSTTDFYVYIRIVIFIVHVHGRKDGRQAEIILVDYLIQILISLDMLETRVTVHMWKKVIILNYLLQIEIPLYMLEYKFLCIFGRKKEVILLD